MPATNNHKPQFDPPWKNILDTYFADFLQLCWSEAYAAIDWSQQPVMLDKELESLMQGNAFGKR